MTYSTDPHRPADGVRPKTPIRKPDGRGQRVNNRSNIRETPNIEPSLHYAMMVSEGRIPASEPHKAFCATVVEDFARQDEVGFPWVFDPIKADRFMRFARNLVMTEGQYADEAWQPLLWQLWYCRTLMGWVDRETGFRRYRKTFLMTSKGSGKKVISAALLLYLLGSDREKGAQVFHLANTYEQCMVVFRYCVQLIDSSPLLREHSGIEVWGGGTNPKKLFKGNNMATAISSTSKAPSGPLPSAILVDEYHEAPSDQMLSLLAAGFKNRRQPLLAITTNRHADEDTPCGAEFLYAKRVAMGEIDDDTYLPALFYNVESDNVLEDESRWEASNPSLPEIPGLPYLRAEVKKAIGMSGHTKAEVLRLNFSIGGQDVGGWISALKWKQVEVNDLSNTKPNATYMGLDLSLTTDLSAAVVVYDYLDHMEAFAKVWMPLSKLNEMEQTDHRNYSMFRDEGYLTMSGVETIEYQDIVDFIMETHQNTPITALAFDTWGMREVKRLFDNHGFAYDTTGYVGASSMYLADHPQGFSAKADPDPKKIHLAMPRSIKRTEETILNQQVKILFNPLLRIAAMSTMPIMDGHNNRKLTKKGQNTRIDPMVALTMAIGIAHEYRNPHGRFLATDIDKLVMNL